MCDNTPAPKGPPEPLEIKLFRRKVGWSQRRLAEELGVDKTYISHLEADDPMKAWAMRPRLLMRYRALEKRVHAASRWQATERTVLFSKFKMPPQLIVLARPRKCRGHRRYCLFKTRGQVYCGPECKRLWEDRRSHRERHKRRKRRR